VIAFPKKDLLLYYGTAYLIVALLETILFLLIGGHYSFIDIVTVFSIWGIVWIITLFAYPLFLTDADPSKLNLSPYYALFGYVIIVIVYYIAYRWHKTKIEEKVGQKITITQLLDLYFPLPQEFTEKQDTQESKSATK